MVPPARETLRAGPAPPLPRGAHRSAPPPARRGPVPGRPASAWAVIEVSPNVTDPTGRPIHPLSWAKLHAPDVAVRAARVVRGALGEGPGPLGRITGALTAEVCGVVQASATSIVEVAGRRALIAAVGRAAAPGSVPRPPGLARAGEPGAYARGPRFGRAAIRVPGPIVGQRRWGLVADPGGNMNAGVDTGPDRDPPVGRCPTQGHGKGCRQRRQAARSSPCRGDEMETR